MHEYTFIRMHRTDTWPPSWLVSTNRVWEDNVGGRGSSLWGRFFMIYQFLWEYRPRKKTIIHQSVLKFLFLKQKM